MKVFVFKIVVSLLFLLPFSGTAVAMSVKDYIKKGDAQMQKDNISAAISTYGKLIDMYRQNPGDYADYAVGFRQGGMACYGNERYVEALDFFTLCMDAARKSDNETLYEACLGNIGNIFAYFYDYEKSTSYFEKGYESAVKHKNFTIAGKFIRNLVANYCYLNQVDRAKRFFRIQAQMPQDKEATYYLLINQALIAVTEQKYTMAIYYCKKTIDFLNHYKMPPAFKGTAYSMLADSYDGMGKADSAIANYMICVDITKRNNLQEHLASSYQALADIYKKIGDKKNDMKYRLLYQTLSDSIFNRQQFNAAQHKLSQYEDEITNEHINNLNTKINIQLIVIIVITFLAICLIVALIRVYLLTKNLRESNQVLFEKNEETLRRQEPMESEPLSRDESPESQKQLIDDIRKAMEDMENISNPEFSVVRLSQIVGSNTSYVSRAINQTYQKNFKSLLNELRVKEASKRLGDKNDRDVTIAAIATEVGFRSVNNFIVSFKKIVGMTPSVYQKMARTRHTKINDSDADLMLSADDVDNDG